MTLHNSSKINYLLKVWPRGTVAINSWFKIQGISRQLLDSYEKSRWVSRIGHGAYARADDLVDWTGGIYAIQEQLKLPIHVGSKTALQISGLSHQIPLGKGQRVFLFGASEIKLPRWFKEYNWDAKIHYTMTNLFGKSKDLGLALWTMKDYAIVISSPERAIMELLYFVPKQESFEEAVFFMEGLTAATLRPKLVQDLLETCNSIRVKRLFMCLAEKLKHPWVQKIDLTNVNFGKGKRVIVKGGVLDSKYKIVVPKINYGIEEIYESGE